MGEKYMMNEKDNVRRVSPHVSKVNCVYSELFNGKQI